MDAAAWKRYDMAEVNRALRQQRRAAHWIFRAHEQAMPGRRPVLEWVHRHRRTFALLAGGVTVLVIALGLLAALDYGWTAYDAWQAARILRNPSASPEQRLEAGLTLGLAGLEVLESDEWFSAALPLDDLARRALIREARQAFEAGGIEALEASIRRSLGEHADEILTPVYKALCCNGQRHHVFSSRIMRELQAHPTLRGVFDRDDIIVRALDEMSHRGYQSWHRAYDDEVRRWLQSNRRASKEEFLRFLIELYSGGEE